MAKKWLFKTEPGAYSFSQLQQDKHTVWDGVKNNLALKNLAQVKKGDLVIIYHTGDEKAAAGIAKAASDAYPDPKNKDTKLMVVDLEAVRPLPQPVALKDIKANTQLVGFDLVRLPRLSVMPVTDEQWSTIEKMARA